MQQLSAIGPDCLSELEIDEWLAGELSAAEVQRCALHVERCSDCLQRKRAIEGANAQFYAQSPTFGALRDHVASRAPAARPTRRTSRWRGATAPLALACAGLAALLLWRPGAELEAPDETRTKGGPRLGYFVKRGDAVVRGDEGVTVRPGDSLRFVYSAERASYFALVSVDARGASVYYPATARAVALPAGQDLALEFSVELDDAPGAERVIGVFCSQAFEIEPARSALAAGAPLPAALASCQRAELELKK